MYSSYKTKEEFVATTESSARIQLEVGYGPVRRSTRVAVHYSGRRDCAEARFKVSTHSKFPFSAGNGR